MIFRKLLIEFLGTLLLTFTVLSTHNYLAIGAALAIAVFLGKGSYNPAVAIAQMMHNEIREHELILMIASEILGAIVAYYLVTVRRKLF
jgi:glycerol uptake facilitator-like aquaporin